MRMGEVGSELVVKVTPGHGFYPPPRLLKSCRTIFKIFNPIIIIALLSFEPEFDLFKIDELYLN
ncbi:hypothetical protein PtVFX2014_09725 [Legionella pneumophila]|nr:hypothetical protein BJK09_00295 [Legionella pneumophila]AUB70345.1 hypothetical protein BJK08_00295 [Legionella pneumophila]KXB25062.1 hypothetical protein PtVF66_09650 [Legionella pneumophila]KZX33569.1 hypothetical protein PtVFX2014_09725 [Legionella pneumophila]